jgi:hypothetical protein
MASGWHGFKTWAAAPAEVAILCFAVSIAEVVVSISLSTPVPISDTGQISASSSLAFSTPTGTLNSHNPQPLILPVPIPVPYRHASGGAGGPILSVPSQAVAYVVQPSNPFHGFCFPRAHRILTELGKCGFRTKGHVLHIHIVELPCAR